MDRWRWSVVAICLYLTGLPVVGQETKSNVILELEIVTPRLGVNQLDSQRWGKFFRDQSEVVRVREPIAGDEVKATEIPRGTFRLVRVLGQLDREGKLHVPEHILDLKQPEHILAWLKEIKTYGAQGSPEGKPHWGLNQQQFNAVFTALSDPLTVTVKDRPLGEVLKEVKLPAEYPLQFHLSVKQSMAVKDLETVRDEVHGITTGSGLAAILAQHGLGFRPRRTPQGGLELVVESLGSIPDPWPVGWGVKRTERGQVAPTLFSLLPAGFDDISLEDVLAAMASQQPVPLIISRSACAEKEIDLTTKVNYAQKKQTAWALILDSVVHQARLQWHLRQDEAGNPIVFISPFDPKSVMAE